MTHWVLLAAPLILASSVLVFAFVGCSLDSEGLGPGEPPASEQYSTDVTTKAISYWRLGEPPLETTAADSKGSNPGTYVGGVTLGVPGLVVGGPDTAAHFDGSTGYVSVPHNDNSLNPPSFTVEALVNVEGDGQYGAVVSSRDISTTGEVFGYVLYASDQNRWEAWVGDGGLPPWQILTGPDVTPGVHYLAMTYDKTTLKLYLDPFADEPLSADVPYQPNTVRELRIGAGANELTDPQWFFNGVIDEVAVYDFALDFATLHEHFSLALPG
jgi:hypothetical protein